MTLSQWLPENPFGLYEMSESPAGAGRWRRLGALDEERRRGCRGGIRRRALLLLGFLSGSDFVGVAGHKLKRPLESG
ncbi:hypothetical protein BH11CYA1_BH11CYA1_50360 [soil metagenome]